MPQIAGMCEFHKAQNCDNVDRVYYDIKSFKMKINTFLNSKEYAVAISKYENGELFAIYIVLNVWNIFYDLNDLKYM